MRRTNGKRIKTKYPIETNWRKKESNTKENTDYVKEDLMQEYEIGGVRV